MISRPATPTSFHIVACQLAVRKTLLKQYIYSTAIETPRGKLFIIWWTEFFCFIFVFIYFLTATNKTYVQRIAIGNINLFVRVVCRVRVQLRVRKINTFTFILNKINALYKIIKIF